MAPKEAQLCRNCNLARPQLGWPVDLRVGTILADKYMVLRCVGRGGFGMVYKVFDQTRQDICALKILKSELAHNDDAVRRFKDEASILTKLRGCENIVHIMDFGQLTTGEFFMGMEFIEGTDLGRLLQHRGKLAIDEAMNIGREVAVALAEANRIGVLHRDLKPDNIILTPHPTRGTGAKVLDFGVAKFIEETTRLTATGFVAGTPAYMSYEQWMQAKDLDIRSDVYALGVVLYRMLSGELPYQGSSDSPVAIYEKLKRGKFTPLRKHRPDLPTEIEAVIHRLLARDRDKRPNTPEEVIALIDRVLDKIPTTLTPDMRVGSQGPPASIFASGDPGLAKSADADSGATTQVRRLLMLRRREAMVFPDGPPNSRLGQRRNNQVAIVLITAVVVGLGLAWWQSDALRAAMDLNPTKAPQTTPETTDNSVSGFTSAHRFPKTGGRTEVCGFFGSDDKPVDATLQSDLLGGLEEQAARVEFRYDAGGFVNAQVLFRAGNNTPIGSLDCNHGPCLTDNCLQLQDRRTAPQ